MTHEMTTVKTPESPMVTPPLLREALGEGLRRRRLARGRTLREVAELARVSPGYLSEIERGRKEASSELLAAVCIALGLSLGELLTQVAALVLVAEGRGGRVLTAA